jgi:hypothetical protein
MPILINQEAIRQLQSPLDIERFCERLKTDTDLFTFPNPNLEVIDKNLFYLLKYSKEIDFDQKYRFRPDYLSYDEYGTTILWQLLMYVNGVFSSEDFDLKTVVIPSKDAVVYILQDLFPEPSSQNLTSVSW